MGNIPVLNDTQMKALRGVLSTNPKIDLTENSGQKSRRLPHYEEDPVINSEYPFKITVTGGGSEPPILHMNPGRVILQSQYTGDAVFDIDHCQSFSVADEIDFDFSDAEEGQYLVAGWVYIGDPPENENENENAEETDLRCGILIGKYPDMMTRNGIPNGGGFFLFNIGVIDLEYPEESEEPELEEEPEEEPEEQEEEEEVYPTLSVTEQFIHGSFSITDKYFDLPFSPRLIMDIPETSDLWESDNLVAESAIIRNAPTYNGFREVYKMLEDEGCDLEIGNTYYAYIFDNGFEVKLLWSTSKPQAYEEEEAEEESGEEGKTVKIRNKVVAEIVYLEDEPFKINLYQLSAYADIPAGRGGYDTYMVMVNDEDWPPDYLESKIIGDEVTRTDIERYKEATGYIKHIVVEVENEEDENDPAPGEDENEEEKPYKTFALKSVWDYAGIAKFFEHESPMTLITKDAGNGKLPKLEWESYGKIRTEDADKNPGFLKNKIIEGLGIHFTWTSDNRLKISSTSTEIDQNAQWLLEFSQDGKLDTTISGPPSSGKYYLGANNGTLGWQTGDSSGGGGGGSSDYNGMWAVTLDKNNYFCVEPFSGGNHILVNSILAKTVTEKIRSQVHASENTTEYIYLFYEPSSGTCLVEVRTEPITGSYEIVDGEDYHVLLAVWSENMLIQVQYGPIKLANAMAGFTGPFDVKIENGSVIVYDSSNPNSNTAGYVKIGSHNYSIQKTTVTVSTGTLYLNAVYTTNSGISFTFQIGQYPQTDSRQQYTLRIAKITNNGTQYNISRTRIPGDIEILGRWFE